MTRGLVQRAVLGVGLVIALALGSGARAAAVDSVETLVAYLDGLETLAARFTQARYDEYGELLETAGGEARIARPGRFRWEYTEPYVQTLVTDGRTFWIHDVDLNQVTVNAVGAGGRGSPAELLGAEFAVLDRYTIARLADEDGLAWFRLTPNAPDREFQAVDLGMRDGELAAMRLQDNLGQTTRLEFSAVIRNGPIDPARFEFTPPPGVDIVQGGAP